MHSQICQNWGAMRNWNDIACLKKSLVVGSLCVRKRVDCVANLYAARPHLKDFKIMYMRVSLHGHTSIIIAHASLCNLCSLARRRKVVLITMPRSLQNIFVFSKTSSFALPACNFPPTLGCNMVANLCYEELFQREVLRFSGYLEHLGMRAFSFWKMSGVNVSTKFQWFNWITDFKMNYRSTFIAFVYKVNRSPFHFSSQARNTMKTLRHPPWKLQNFCHAIFLIFEITLTQHDRYSHARLCKKSYPKKPY